MAAMTKILIIDDSLFQQKLLAGMLKEDGYDLIFSGNGREGIMLLEQKRPDLVIADLLMPDYDGYYFLEQVKERGIGVPVIILTSDVQKATMERCRNLGAAGFLNKPVNRETLTGAIQTMLSGAKQR
jgi:twitching motility two-component system response regulator PilH